MGISTVAPKATPTAGAVSQNSQAGTADPTASTLFFEKVVRPSQGSSLKIDGIGFLSRDSEVTQPFMFSLDNLDSEVNISTNPVFVPVPKGVVFLQPEAKNVQLQFINPVDFDIQTIAANLESSLFAVTADRKTVLIENLKGEVSQVSSTRTSRLDLAGETPKKFLAVPLHSEWIVVTDQSVFWFGPELTSVKFDAQDIAIDPTGQRFLLIGKNGVELYDRQTQTKSKTAELTADIRESAFRDENLIAFWQIESGDAVLHTFDFQSRENKQITNLGSGVFSDGMICPVWNQGKLYFASPENKNWAIEKVEWDSGDVVIKPFAELSDSRFGLICPRSL